MKKLHLLLFCSAFCASEQDVRPEVPRKPVAPTLIQSGQALDSGKAGRRYSAERDVKETKNIFDVRDHGLACDGTTDDTAAMSTLEAIGARDRVEVEIPEGRCLLGSVVIPANVTLDFFPGGELRITTGQIVRILGTTICA
jgi:hypothetical protein